MKSVILLGVLAVVILPLAAPTSVVAQTPITEVYAHASDGTPLTWIVFTPAGSGPWPAVLVVHGGNFFGGEPGDAGVTSCAQSLANAGYVAFAIDYRLAPPGSIRRQQSSGRFPEQYEDVHLAIQAARTNSRSNGKVGAVGGSAGGTHAAWTAATGVAGDDRLDVAVCLSGAYDFSDFNPDENLGLFIEIVTNYVGVDSSNEAALRAASPAWILDTSVAPLFIIDTVEDLMPGIQLDDMVAQLDAAGVQNYESMRIPGALHSFAYWSDIETEAIAFLSKGFATPSPTPTATPSPTVSPSPTATPTPTVSPTPTPTPGPSGDALLDLSTRARAGTGEEVLIGGFILGPSGGAKRILVRAIGPSLTAAGVASALADPSLQLLDSTGQIVASNDDWMTGGQTQEIIDTTLAPNEPRESVVLASLAPGAYTAIVDGAEGTQNIALVEVYDLDSLHTPRLLNISTRGRVETGEAAMIAGTIIGGTNPATLVIRALGPSFSEGPAPISDPLPDPMLMLVDSQGTTLFSNDNWQDTQAGEIEGAGLPLPNLSEAGILVTLPPGSYTALMSDTGGASGIGLIEIYNITNNQVVLSK